MSISAGLERNNRWKVRSSLSGRLRVICNELKADPLLRHHCAITLTNCNWLYGFRINKLQGSVVIRFPDHRHAELALLLQQAFVLPVVDQELSAPLARLKLEGKWANVARARAIRHGTSCGLVLLTDVLFPIPAALITAAALLALLPLVREVRHKWWRKHTLPAETLELAFSTAMIGGGFAREALLDFAMGDASDALESLLSNEENGGDESKVLVERLGRLVVLDLVDCDRQSCQLKDAERGMQYRASTYCHVFLESEVVEGEILVLNYLMGGDWHPIERVVGQQVAPGSLVIKGNAILQVVHELGDHKHDRCVIDAVGNPQPPASRLERDLEIYNMVMTPLLLSLGGTWYLMGDYGRALGWLQFNPMHDWKISRLSLLFTAMASLRMHGIQLHHPNTLITLAKVEHIVISDSCFDRRGGMHVREILDPNYAGNKGELLRLLAGVQTYLVGRGQAPLWSEQLDQMPKPLLIQNVDLSRPVEGWRITLKDGRHFVIKETIQAAENTSTPQLIQLEVYEGESLIGALELINRPDDVWAIACQALESMGITVHIIGAECDSGLHQLRRDLAISSEVDPGADEKPLYGHCDADARVDFVRRLQGLSSGVAYVGNVLLDLPALNQADVSISIDSEAGSIFSSGICDIHIGLEAHCLPRLFLVSRRLDWTAKSNFALIGATNLLSAIATLTSWISPLITVLLSDLPLLLAELRNINAVSSHRIFAVRESEYPQASNSPGH
jgi:hypothetical protein